MAPTPREGQWSTGLLACCASPGGLKLCCYGAWCSCCLVGDTYARMPNHAPVMCGGSWAGACLTNAASYACLLGGALPQTMGRQWLRRKYGIQGSDMADFFVSCFCSECAACQEARELDLRHGRGQPVDDPPPAYLGYGGAPAPNPMPTAAGLKAFVRELGRDVGEEVDGLMGKQRPAQAPPVTGVPAVGQGGQPGPAPGVAEGAEVEGRPAAAGLPVR